MTTARCQPLPSQHTLRTELYKVGPAYRLKSEKDIMDEIMESGPVQGNQFKCASIQFIDKINKNRLNGHV